MELTGLDALRLLAADDRIDTAAPSVRSRSHVFVPLVTVRGIPVCRPLPHVADHVVQAVAVGRGTLRPGAGARRSHQVRGSLAETHPARCWPCNGRLDGDRHPRRTRSRAGRRGPRTPIPPRWVSPCLPNSRAGEERSGHAANGSPGDQQAVAQCGMLSPPGCCQSAPGTYDHHRYGSLRSTGCDGGVKTAEAGASMAVSAPGYMDTSAGTLRLRRLISGGRDKSLELGIRDRIRVDPEATDAHRMGRRLLGIVAI